MPKWRFPPLSWRLTGLAVALMGLLQQPGVAANGRPVPSAPAAPTIPDAHQFFESLVAGNTVSALYTASREGELLGYLAFPVRRYGGAACKSAMTLSNDVDITIDWAVVSKAQANDGEVGMWHWNRVDYQFFHMLTIEGGTVAAPANNIPRLVLAVNDEVSRNRLLKAVTLLASTCRAKSKFD